MKTIGVIPARYNSTRFPGKPLVDICGKPMIWWVYQQVIKVPELSEVYVACDNMEIFKECEKYNINAIMTKNNHPNHISRIQEVSSQIESDLYICVNGDEPLIDEHSISLIANKAKELPAFFSGAYRYLSDPTETIDNANIKIVTNGSNQAIYMSRTPIPYPAATLNFKYKKYVGIECFTKESLDFFVNTPMGIIEKIEDIDHLRFIENGKILKFYEVKSESISVDTPKDLERIKQIIKDRQSNG